ncbi:hypothetical protein BDW69DRAFT_146261 [Aspergillus filifer]
MLEGFHWTLHDLFAGHQGRPDFVVMTISRRPFFSPCLSLYLINVIVFWNGPSIYIVLESRGIYTPL